MAWNFRALKGTMEKASLLSSLVTWETEAPRRKGLDLGHTTEAGYARRKSSLSCYFLLCFSTCLPPFVPSLLSIHVPIHPSTQADIHLSSIHASLSSSLQSSSIHLPTTHPPIQHLSTHLATYPSISEMAA